MLSILAAEDFVMKKSTENAAILNQGMIEWISLLTRACLDDQVFVRKV